MARNSSKQTSPIEYRSDGSIAVEVGGDIGVVEIPRATVRTWKNFGVAKERADEWLTKAENDIRERTGWTVELEAELYTSNTKTDAKVAAAAQALVDYRTQFDMLLYSEDNPYPKLMSDLTGVAVDDLPAWTINPAVYDDIIRHWLNVPLNPSNPAQ